MSDTPRISVIMPFYNAARFIRHAVQSILDQTYADLELIVVDDGSEDSSLAIVKEFVAADTRMRCISRANTGIVGALNDGISLARGEFLARMDADDIAVSNRLERQANYLERHADCVVVGSAVTIVNQDGEAIEQTKVLTQHKSIEELLLQGRGSLCHPTVMMRTWAVREVGGYREEYRMATEDMDLFLRLAEVGRLANIPESLLLYRWHMESISHRKNHLDAMRTRAAMVREACRRRGIPEREIEPKTLTAPEPSEKDRLIAHYYHWSYSAAKAGRSRVARKYALAALRLAPLQKPGWSLLCKSLVGFDATEWLTKLYRRVKFWK